MTEAKEISNSNGVYIVFGGTGGIGSLVVERLTNSGAHVVATGRDSGKLNSLSNNLAVTSYHLDLSTGEGDIDDCVNSTFEKFGRLDGVANCIGSLLLKPAHLTTDNDWDSIMSTNLSASFRIVRASVRSMMRTGGSIVLVSSAAASLGLASHEAIAASKAGVEGLARATAASYCRRNIRVNCVAPGLVETDLTASLLATEVNRKASETMHPLGRIGQPEDISSAIAWLLSPESSWITGQVVTVDGGLTKVRSKG